MPFLHGESKKGSNDVSFRLIGKILSSYTVVQGKLCSYQCKLPFLGFLIFYSDTVPLNMLHQTI